MERILSIDPSSSKTGYVIAKLENDEALPLDYGLIELKKEKQPLKRLYETLEEKILKYTIEKIILETPFYSVNAQTLIKLGEVRGVILLLAQNYNIKVEEFSPAEVKISITGYGRSGKEEVLEMVNKIFNLNIKDYDIADAFAILHCYMLNKVGV
jgi:crossover junction endodeoxyribonuclease RuvC